MGALILIIGYRFIFSSPQDKKDVLLPGPLICFGDSLTYGTGTEKGMDYPSQLSMMVSQAVVNAGIPGNTTAQALKRLEQDVLSRSPGLVLITLGGNDLKNGVAKEIAFKNLKIIVETIQDHGARVVIGGIQFPLRDRGFGKGYKELADQTGAILIPNILKGIMGNRKLMSDPIHPNAEGYKIMAQRFYEAILKID